VQARRACRGRRVNPTGHLASHCCLLAVSCGSGGLAWLAVVWLLLLLVVCGAGAVGCWDRAVVLRPGSSSSSSGQRAPQKPE
jgi:hypothetical protein